MAKADKIKRKGTNGKIVVVTHPISAAGLTPLTHLIEILQEVPRDLCLITGDEGWKHYQGAKGIEVYGIISNRTTNPYKRIINFIRNQLWITYTIVRKAQDAGTVMFLFGGDYLLLPILTTKLLRKKTIVALVGSSHQSMRSDNDPFSGIVEMLATLIYALADRIITHSPSSICDPGMVRYRNKITFCRRHYVKIPPLEDKTFDERDNIIGYVGRLMPEKGIMNLIEAIPIILKTDRELKFLIIGDGLLKSRIEAYLKEHVPPGTVQMTGWVDHEELPPYLAKIRLMVFPSEIELLPNAMLEAMASGTPALATPVGSIPDVIVDGKNGFLMEDNDPNTVAREVLRALHHPDLPTVSKNARALAVQEFGFEQTVVPWREALSD